MVVRSALRIFLTLSGKGELPWWKRPLSDPSEASVLDYGAQSSSVQCCTSLRPPARRAARVPALADSLYGTVTFSVSTPFSPPLNLPSNDSVCWPADNGSRT